MIQPGRTFSAGTNYRYGFNGKENDNEVKGEGNQQDYGMRIYDPRLGKFLSVDPLTKKYPELTPYQFASNTPIWATDLDGLEANFDPAKLKRVEYTKTGAGTFFDVLANPKEFGANSGISAWNQTVDAAEIAVNLFTAKGREKIDKKLLTPTFNLFMRWSSKTPQQQLAASKNFLSKPENLENIVGSIASGWAINKGLGTLENVLNLGSRFERAINVGVGVKNLSQLENFASGGTKLVSSEMLAKYATGSIYGAEAGTFISPTAEINSLLEQGLNRTDIAMALGITDVNFLKGTLIRIDVESYALKGLNLRSAVGTEIGANSLFQSGGKTVGGITEGVVDGIPKTVSSRRANSRLPLAHQRQ